ncbi:hypothetical protein BSR28_00800 [Boudabousia liubingyangii]|uniref:RDD family protein n=1 Tax=Boudabousia liubingyangii TaxID=1921764 RepID=UPI0009404243|nr:RDD family protein [Boudabousia liubingyangii]OKL48280.1 hypothetical protein BSR28_00800 [Boudabousia liubingyangii]
MTPNQSAAGSNFFKPASLGKRILAGVIDGGIALLLVVLAFVLGTDNAELVVGDGNVYFEGDIYSAFLIFNVLAIIYLNVALFMVIFSGASLGDRVAGIRSISAKSNGNPGFRSFAKHFVYLVLFVVFSIVTVLLSSVVAESVAMLLVVAAVAFLVVVIPQLFLFGDYRRNWVEAMFGLRTIDARTSTVPNNLGSSAANYSAPVSPAPVAGSGLPQDFQPMGYGEAKPYGAKPEMGYPQSQVVESVPFYAPSAPDNYNQVPASAPTTPNSYNQVPASAPTTPDNYNQAQASLPVAEPVAEWQPQVHEHQQTVESYVISEVPKAETNENPEAIHQVAEPLPSSEEALQNPQVEETYPETESEPVVANTDDWDSELEKTVFRPRYTNQDVPKLTLDDGTQLTLAQPFVFGRGPAAKDGQVAYKLEDPSFSVSKTHLLVEVNDGKVMVTDLNSTNGTKIKNPDEEEKWLNPNEATALQSGSVIHLGERTITLS